LPSLRSEVYLRSGERPIYLLVRFISGVKDQGILRNVLPLVYLAYLISMITVLGIFVIEE